MRRSAFSIAVLVLLALVPVAGGNPPTTQPVQPSQRLTIEFSGAVRANPYALAAPASTDANARAATWRYYYSPPACYYGYWYGGWRGWYGGGSRCGRPYGICIEFGGCY